MLNVASRATINRLQSSTIYIVMQSTLTSNLLEKLWFCFKWEGISDLHIIFLFSRVSICKVIDRFFYNSFEEVTKNREKSNPTPRFGLSSDENAIPHGGNVLNHLNVAF